MSTDSVSVGVDGVSVLEEACVRAGVKNRRSCTERVVYMTIS
jgi:hypothetical protein